MKGPFTVKSAIIWGVSLMALFVALTIINWFIYPFTSANPNFNDVETVFDSIQVPSDWTLVEQSENRGIAGRQCPIESESMCFHKSKTFKVDGGTTNEEAMNLLTSTNCPVPSVANNLQTGSAKESFSYTCMNGLVRLISSWDKSDGQVTVSLSARSR